MAQATNVTSLFADLQRLGQSGDYERAIKITNKILQEVPTDEKAFHSKIVCLIQLGRFDEALKVIHKNQDLASNLVFEKGYCEYRLNRTGEALKTLQSVPTPDYRMKELLAQVLYRLENYSECFDVYKDLVKNTQDDYEEERETNLSAVMAAMQTWSEDDPEDLGLREDTYEMCYNSACLLLGKDQYKAAAEKLRQAEALCRASFEDDPDVTEEDMDEELGVIRVQLGFALQMMHKDADALKLYNQVIKTRPTDIGLAAVASNNIVSLNKEQNVFDSKKKIKVATADGLQQKLTSQQRQTISMNQCLLYMYTNQNDQCFKAVRSLQEQYPESDLPGLIQAAQYCRDKQMPKAIDALEDQVSKKGEGSLSTKLTLAQLHLSQGSIYKACDVLRSLGDLSQKPGVVSAMVTLYLSQEDKEAAAEVLDSAVTWHKTNMPNTPELQVMIRACANFHLSHGQPQVATQMLEELRKSNPKDLKTLAQLISAYSKFDPKKAQTISRELPSPGQLAADVDVEALELSASSLSHKYVKKVTTKTDQSPKPQSPQAATEELLQKKKKRKKKGKLPKNYDAKCDPDPERWLPRRERSYYRGKRKDKRKDIGKGTQGAAPGGADLDMNKPASPSSSNVGSPRPGSTPGPSAGPGSAAAGPRQQKNQSKQKKKKKGKNK